MNISGSGSFMYKNGHVMMDIGYMNNSKFKRYNSYPYWAFRGSYEHQ